MGVILGVYIFEELRELRCILSEEYRSLVARLRDAIDRLWSGNGYDELRRLSAIGSRYEWMFWDMAYKMEEWPV